MNITLNPLTLLQDGGGFQYLILLGGVAGLPLSIILSLLSARLRIPAAAHLLLTVPLVGQGILGTHMGLVMLAQALPNASPEVAPILAASGLSIARYTTIFASLFSGIILAVRGGVRWGPGERNREEMCPKKHIPTQRRTGWRLPP